MSRTDLPALRSLFERAGADPSRAPSAFADLTRRYGEPHRHHHTLDHVDHVLRHLDTTARDLPDTRAVELAAWYHDVIYRGEADDERASADHATTVLGDADCDAAVLADVSRLIIVTQHHQPTVADEAALCDADLAVLAAAPDGYERYRLGVRAEYARLDDDTWRSGRAAVLRRLLERPALFHTAAFAEREAIARRNLTTELATLEGHAS